MTDLEALLSRIQTTIIIKAASSPPLAGLKTSNATTIGCTENSLTCAAKCPSLGNGTGKFDSVYAENIVNACMCCIEAMINEETHELVQCSEVAGEAFNGEPVELRSFDRLVWCLAGDNKPPEKTIVVPMELPSEGIMWVFSAETKKPDRKL
ncbi:hypothetical protein sscle_16g108390 [Sclerotinia sclerotiorum 1980 UF-70]|nr:hypothetical protein sscle_16g108390 [Sclerotinia sclerotiorum 1980 UF-70]